MYYPNSDFDPVNAAAKLILKDLPFQNGIQVLFNECNSQFPDPIWRQAAQKIDFEDDCNSLEEIWNAERKNHAIPPSVRTIIVQILDDSMGLDAHVEFGGPLPSREWWRSFRELDEFGFYSEGYDQLVRLTIDRIELLELKKVALPEERVVDDPGVILNQFCPFVLYWILFRELIRRRPTCEFLHNGEPREFIVAVAEGECGVLAGRLTTNGWVPAELPPEWWALP